MRFRRSESAFRVTGEVIAYGGATAPTGWLLCNGAAVSRTTYAALFAIIGTAFGAGDGSTTFNVPDLRGRAPIGAGQGTGLTNRVLGSNVGTETHTLVTAEMPAHTHTAGAGVTPLFPDGGSVVRDNSVGTIATSSTGGGGAHNNMQPSQAVTFIIKT